MAFIGLRVPAGTATALQRLARGGELENPADYHITLIYLGDELSPETLHACRVALAQVARRTSVFDVDAAAVTTFPPHPRHGTVPSIVRIQGNELHRLRAEVVAALTDHGVAIDNTFPDFKPHVTLSYFPDAESGKAAPSGPIVPMIYWPVTEMYLWDKDEGMDSQEMFTLAATSMTNRLVARTLVAEEDVPKLVADFRSAAADFLTFRKEIAEAFELGLEYGNTKAMPEEDAKKVKTALGNVTYSKPHLLVPVVIRGRALFQGLLSSLAMPDALRKKAEAAARVWSTRPMRPKSDLLMALEWYDKKATAVEAHLALIESILAAGKSHSEGEGGAGTKVKAGPFTLVNTGGFKPDVMAKMVDIASKAATLLQQSGFGSIAYGDIQITNSLMRSNVLAFYNLKDDKLYIRANVKSSWDTLQTVLHELGHRWENKKLKHGVAEKLYRMVDRQEDARDLPPPPLGDTIVNRNRTFEVAQVRGDTVYVRIPGSTGIPAAIKIDQYYAMKGHTRDKQRETDPNYKGFVTNYAKTDAAENFAEMFSFYCMGDLPVAQSGLFEELVLGDGKLASRLTRRLLARSMFSPASG